MLYLDAHHLDNIVGIGSSCKNNFSFRVSKFA